VLLASAFLLRLVVAPLTRHEWDMMVWTRAGREFLHFATSPYDVLLQTAQTARTFYYYYAYPPVWFASIVQSYFLFELMPFNSAGALYTWIKLPLMLTDLILGCLIYDSLSPRIGEDNALYASAAYLLNPYVIWISSVWTMHDCVAACFTFLAYRLYLEDRPKASALCLGAAISTKIYPVFGLPIFLMRKEKRKDIFLYLALVSVIPLLVSVPFLIRNYKSYLFMFQFHLQRTPTGVTYWEIARVVHKLRVPVRLRMEYERVVGDIAGLMFPLSVGCFAVLTQRMRAKNWTQERFLTALLAGCLIYFFTMKNVHPPFLVWITPLMITSASIVKESRRDWHHYWLLSALFFLYFSINEPLWAFWGESMPDWYYDNTLFRISLWFIGIAATLVEVSYFKVLLRRLGN